MCCVSVCVYLCVRACAGLRGSRSLNGIAHSLLRTQLKIKDEDLTNGHNGQTALDQMRSDLNEEGGGTTIPSAHALTSFTTLPAPHKHPPTHMPTPTHHTHFAVQAASTSTNWPQFAPLATCGNSTSSCGCGSERWSARFCSSW